MSHLRAIRPALVASKFSSVKGARPQFKELPLSVLEVDPSYQREEYRRTHCKPIAENWHWGAVVAIAVAHRSDDTYYVYDGQQRVVAARMRGDIEALPCMVIKTTSAKEEAELFGIMNDKRLRIKPDESYVAAVCAEKSIEKQIHDFLASIGVEISRKPGVNKTTAIAQIRSFAKRPGGLGDVMTVLGILRGVWPGEEHALSGRAFMGMSRLWQSLDGDGQRVLLDLAGERFGRYSVREILNAAEQQSRATGIGVVNHLPKVFKEFFNRNAKRYKLA